MDARDKLLDVTAKIYAELGYRGTTTRRIADDAGVNEVTLFRHFGTKDVLIKAALEAADRRGRPEPLGEPHDPEAELHHYARQCFDHFYRHRRLIARVMGDMVENPGIAPSVCEEPNKEHSQLAGYLVRLRDRGMATRDVMPDVAAGLLIGGLLSHALWRDHFPHVPPPETVVRAYTDLLLQALGVSATSRFTDTP